MIPQGECWDSTLFIKVGKVYQTKKLIRGWEFIYIFVFSQRSYCLKPRTLKHLPHMFSPTLYLLWKEDILGTTDSIWARSASLNRLLNFEWWNMQYFICKEKNGKYHHTQTKVSIFPCLPQICGFFSKNQNFTDIIEIHSFGYLLLYIPLRASLMAQW